MSKKLLAIGHATLDTFYKIESPDMVCDILHEKCQVCFGFGDKVPVEDVRYSIGGGAANVAVGVTALGIETYLYSIVGDDLKGKDVLDQLKTHGVNSKYVFVDDLPTDQAFILSYTNERTIFTHNSNRKYDLTKVVFDDIGDVFLSSVGNKVSHLYDQVIQLVKDNVGLRLFYNPGSRELLNAYEDIQRIVPYIDYLIANVEEGCTILNQGLTRNNIEIEDLTNLLREKGIKTVILTDAENGVYVNSGAGFFHTDSVKTEVQEMTGAGDAFASGFISAILYGKDLHEATLWGVNNSSSVIKIVGAQNGLLNYDEITKIVNA